MLTCLLIAAHSWKMPYASGEMECTQHKNKSFSRSWVSFSFQSLPPSFWFIGSLFFTKHWWWCTHFLSPVNHPFIIWLPFHLRFPSERLYLRHIATNFPVINAISASESISTPKWKLMRQSTTNKAHTSDERVLGWVPGFSVMGLDHNGVAGWGGGREGWIAGLLQRSWLILSVCKLPLVDEKRDFIWPLSNSARKTND